MVPDQLRQGAPGSMVHFGAPILRGRRFWIIRRESISLELLKVVLKYGWSILFVLQIFSAKVPMHVIGLIISYQFRQTIQNKKKYDD